MFNFIFDFIIYISNISSNVLDKKLNIINNNIINKYLLFLFFNNLIIGLKVVKKNPIIVAIKNRGNLFKLL